jgi:capsular polysaccharide biosynthesis protein
LISRAGAANRRILNEADLLQALSPLGFERYRLEALPIEEQIALFQDAECVVAPHGAGLANLVFAPETAVVELFAADYIVPHYYLLCKAVGASYAAWNGSQSHHDEDVHANVSAICSLIESSFDKSRQVLTR